MKIRSILAPLALAGVLVFGAACGAASTGDTSGQGAADVVKEAAAKAAADLVVSQVQSALEAAGFTGVTVSSGMETEGGQQFAVVSADVSLPQLNKGCKLNYKSKVTAPDIYFDKVITPDKPEGVKVEGAARNTVSPLSAFNYLAANHTACLVPGAAAPGT